MERVQRVAVLSDLHLSPKDSPKDDFGGPREERRLIGALRTLDDTCDRVVLAGDTLEMWQHSYDEIANDRMLLLSAIAHYVDVVVPGNHDSGIHEVAGRMGIRTVNIFQWNGVMVRHGHDFDPVNSGPLFWVGKGVSKLAGLGEAHIHRDFDKWAESAQRMAGGGRWGKNEHYISEVGKYIEDLPEHSQPEMMVLGHTHEADPVGGDDRFGVWDAPVVNAGTWTGDKSDILILKRTLKGDSNKDWEVSLHSWTSDDLSIVRNGDFV